MRSNHYTRFYLDTRYYEVDEKGNLTLVTSNETNINSTYTSVSHGVYLRNAHGQEILMKPENITWRTLGGSIDLYFFDGPTQPEVTKQYITGAIGLPAMQQYFAFGYHQCRKFTLFVREVSTNAAQAGDTPIGVWSRKSSRTLRTSESHLKLSGRTSTT